MEAVKLFFYLICLGVLISVFVNDVKADEIKGRYSTSTSIDRMISSIAKEADFEKTIRTLIRLESNDGLYPINLQDPSCGITHININTYMKRHSIKNTNFNRNKVCADLIASPQLAITNALEELLYWKSVHCGRGKCSKAQYANVVKSYNTGWNYKSSKANEYWIKFKKAYKELYK